MTLFTKVVIAAALALTTIGASTTSANAALHEGPFHATAESLVFESSGELRCNAHFEGTVTDGAWNPTAEGSISTMELSNCDPECPGATFTTPIHVNFYSNGQVEFEEVHVTLSCFGVALDGGHIESTWDCANHLVTQDQPLRVEGTTIVAAQWHVEWHIDGLESEKC